MSPYKGRGLNSLALIYSVWQILFVLLNLFMDYLLKEYLMVLFNRGSRTLRRWFEAGLIPNSYRTRGGGQRRQWRIKTPAGMTPDLYWKWIEIGDDGQGQKEDFGSPFDGRFFQRALNEKIFPPAFLNWAVKAEENIATHLRENPRGRRVSPDRLAREVAMFETRATR